jgi:hypothetical protein
MGNGPLEAMRLKNSEHRDTNSRPRKAGMRADSRLMDVQARFKPGGPRPARVQIGLKRAAARPAAGE